MQFPPVGHRPSAFPNAFGSDARTNVRDIHQSETASPRGFAVHASATQPSGFWLAASLGVASFLCGGGWSLGQEARGAASVTTDVTPNREPAAAASVPAPLLEPLPERLSQTGLYVAGSTDVIDPRNLPYAPQYPLWTDGATKRRWVQLPEGQRIDASDPDHFVFPVGTRFFKEFSFGTRTETRSIELTSAGPRYATYLWNAEGTDAFLVPERGARGVRELSGGARHDVPSRNDCAVCHEGRRDVVLGFDALQLSADRDPLAPHREPLPDGAVDLPELVRRDLIENLPWAMLEAPPRLDAHSPVERAARGYLYANCGHCHNGEGPLAPLHLDFDRASLEGADAPWRPSAFGLDQASKYLLPGASDSVRVAGGHPEESVLAFRMRASAPAARMPPLGTHRVDAEGVQLIERWIAEDLKTSSF